MKKVMVVMPTYNEKENISNILEKLFSVDLELSVLVVDDNSPDGTGAIVDELRKKYKNLFILHRDKKEGLGTAYLYAYDYVLNNFEFEYIICMDADLSHNPDRIPFMIAELDKGYDLVIGSRYVKNGGIVNWNFYRKLVSFVGNRLAKFIAGIKGVKDCTSGFRAFSFRLLKKMDLKSINIHGYAFLLGFLFEAIRKNAKVKEIPIIFVDRTKGKSKLGKKDVLEFFINAFKLRFKHR